MKTSTLRLAGFASSLFCLSGAVHAQFAFTNANTRLNSSNANIRSGNAVTVIDVNNDGLDDILILDQNRYVKVEYQQPGGTYQYQYIGDFGSGSDPWGMSAADVDHNGYKDVLFNGGSQAKLMKLNNTGTGVLGSIINLPNGGIFCQNGNFMDVNNDGWEDIFMCNDVNESRIWVNNGSGGFPSEQANSVINFNINPGTAAPNDESGNYGSVWTDFDNDGDVDFYIIHCRQGQPPGDVRRTNVLFRNNGNGTYTSAASTYNLASNDQDWTGSFGDIDNDGDFDLFLTKHDATSAYYLNDGNGNFGTSAGTIAFGNMPMQSQYEDFDNDGFVDLIVTGDNDHRLYHNNGDGTFTDATPSEWTVSGSNMLSFASGDINHDGKIDIYSSYGSTYNNPSGSIDDIYWLNSINNGNNFITLDLRGTASTDGALGARAYIYGSWGVQTREVRASESYGTCNSFQLHFGLGTATSIDSIVVNWPANGSPNTVIVNPDINQFLVITEGTCVSPDNVITYNGSPVICPPGSLTLNAPTGSNYSYLWSTGATTQSINVNTPGEYTVRVTQAGNSCVSWAPVVTVTVSPDETPSVSAGSELQFCQGGSVTLTSSNATAYTWSNGATTQSINVNTAGDYYVTIQGACQNWTSDTITVDVLPATPPTGNDVYLPAPASTTVNVTGNNVTWYDAPTAGTLLGTGLSYNTPVINATTTYYAEDSYSYGGGNGEAGPDNHSGTDYSGSNNTNAYQIFDVLNNCTLVSVKVYTDTPGNRTIELRNSSGTVINSIVVNIPVDTSIVTLNWALTPGSAYQLGTNGTDNQSTFGFASPRLKRSNAGVAYPYTLNNVVSITNSSQGSSVYYYFYDWQITLPPTVCTSARTPITVYVSGVGVDEIASEYQIQVYPNPATDHVNIQFTTGAAADASLSVHDLTGRKIMDANLGSVNGNFTQTISTQNMAAGVYKISLTIDGKTYHSLIVKK